MLRSMSGLISASNSPRVKVRSNRWKNRLPWGRCNCVKPRSADGERDLGLLGRVAEVLEQFGILAVEVDPISRAATSMIARSKSSPPRYVSPLVASTLNTPSAEREDRAVERAAAEIVDRDGAVAPAVEAVGEGGGGRLVDDAKHVQPGDAARRRGSPAAANRRSTRAR